MWVSWWYDYQENWSMIINGMVGCVFTFSVIRQLGVEYTIKSESFGPLCSINGTFFFHLCFLVTPMHVWPLRKCIGNGERWCNKCKNLMLYIVMVFKTIQTNWSHVKINIYCSRPIYIVRGQYFFFFFLRKGTIFLLIKRYERSKWYYIYIY